MRKTLSIFGSCMVIVGLVLMIGAAGMSDTGSGLADVVDRVLAGLAFVAVGSLAAGLAEIQRRGDR